MGGAERLAHSDREDASREAGRELKAVRTHRGDVHRGKIMMAQTKPIAILVNGSIRRERPHF